MGLVTILPPSPAGDIAADSLLYYSDNTLKGGSSLTDKVKQPLVCFSIPLPVQLAALWAAALGCYVYGDLLSHWVPGAQARMDAGDMGPLGTVTPGLLSGIAVFMSGPAVMIALSVLLPPGWSRRLNLALGAIYTLLVGASLFSAPPFYLYLSGVAVVLTATITWLAWRWPRGNSEN